MSKSPIISLVIADDQPVIRSGLRTVLADSKFHIVGEAATGKKALSLTRKHKPDVLLLDVRLPGGDGFGVLESIQKGNLDTRVVMLSAFDNPTYVAKAITNGAWDFLSKGASRSEILAAVMHAFRQEPPEITSALLQIRQTLNMREAHESTGLTAREAQVLRHIALGLSNREIARSLGISIETVKEHVQNTFRKTQQRDRTQAAVWAVKQALV